MNAYVTTYGAHVGIRKALEELGKDKDAIARALKEKGIKGYPGLPCSCPIANYLQEVGFIHPMITSHIYTDEMKYTGINAEGKMETKIDSAERSPEMVDFMVAFDNLEYPELVM